MKNYLSWEMKMEVDVFFIMIWKGSDVMIYGIVFSVFEEVFYYQKRVNVQLR